MAIASYARSDIQKSLYGLINTLRLAGQMADSMGLKSMAKDVPMIETFKGVVPFLISDAVRVVIIIAFPIITLIVPRLL